METFDTLEDVLKELKDVSKYMHSSGCGLTIQRIRKLEAQYKNLDNELVTISNLIESHAVILREKTAMRYQLMLKKDDLTAENKKTLEMLKEIIETKCQPSVSNKDCVETICSRIAEMPKEWTLIQLTSSICAMEFQNVDPEKFETNPLYLTIFNCGQMEIEPFLMLIPEPRDVQRNKLEIISELKLFLKMNKESMNSVQKRFANRKIQMKYYQRRQEVEQNLMTLIKNVESMWLKEWRCLLIGKYQDSSIENGIRTNIEDFLKTEYPSVQFSSKTKELLYYLTKGTQYLSLNELKSGVKQCCQNEGLEKVGKLPKFLKELSGKLALKKQPRHPVILVIDESQLDNFPWEMLDVLQNEPVSRIPSIHFVYFLYKIYEKDIKRGYKIMSEYETGTYVVNPDKDLVNMETRIMSFFNYWAPDWLGTHGRKPTDKEFLDLLTQADIFSYNGHGNGAHILPIDHIQKAFVKAVVLLFGCGSTRITRLGPQAESHGSYHMYLIARCPCVVGMLWEVTDLDTDILTTEFMSHWIPSKAPIHWTHVNKNEWKKGRKNVQFIDELIIKCAPDNSKFCNLELQRALYMAKKNCDFITRAACVVRGLPVKIKKK